MSTWLQNEWIKLLSNHTNDRDLNLWSVLQKNYTSKNRYYHNFNHIESMLKNLEEFETKIDDIDAVKFAIFYHDVIYNSTKKDNELKSAELAINHLKTLKINPKTLETIYNLILSTKTHQIISEKNKDNAYLLDLDLSILGTPWDSYKTYIENIRKEYRMYPDFLYKPARKKVLINFLNRETLYFTEEFKTTHEINARENITKELKTMQ